MAKRKRNDTATQTPSKKRKPKKDDDEIPVGFWPLKAIRGEKRNKNESRYLVEWTEDPRTGQQFPLEWRLGFDITIDAKREWQKYKKKHGKARLANDEEFIQQEYEARVPGRQPQASSTEAPPSSPLAASISKALETNLVNTLNASALEVPETQSELPNNTSSIQGVATACNPEERPRYETLPDTPLISLGTSNIVEESSQTQAREVSPPFASPRGNQESHSTLSSSTDPGNTIPDSQPRGISLPLELSLASSIHQEPTLTSDPGSPSVGVSLRVDLAIDSNEQTSFKSIPSLVHQQTSPINSAVKSPPFQPTTSSREESVSTDVRSEPGYIALSQRSPSSSTPSAQLDLIPSVESDVLETQPIPTQVPRSWSSASQSPVHGENPHSQVSRHSSPQSFRDISPVNQISAKPSENLSIGPVESALRLFKRSHSMARLSQDSPNRSTRPGSAISQVYGLTLQEKLKNSRAPAKALAEARRKSSARSTPLSQETNITYESTDSKSANMEETMDQNNVLQSTEMDVVQPTNGPVTQMPAPAIPTTTGRSTPNAKAIVSPVEEKKPTLKPILGPLEYVVPLPVEGKMRDQYLEFLKSREPETSRFLSNEPRPSARLSAGINVMLDQLSLITVHTDYIIPDQMTQATVSPSQEATWDDYASTKYAFLGHLLDVLRVQPLNILIITHSPRALRGLATYCAGKKVQHMTLGGQLSVPEGEVDGPLKVSLISVDTLRGETQPSFEPFDLVIAFESEVGSQGSIPRPVTGKIPPMIYLTVKNSPEHAALCLAKDMDHTEYLKAIVREVVGSKRFLGKVDFGTEAEFSQYPDYSQRIQAMKKDFNIKIMMVAKAVAHCLSEPDFDAAWPFPPVNFDSVDKFDIPPPPPVRVTTPSRSRTSTPSSSPFGQKRSLDVPDISGGKRQRLSPLNDVTHVTDSAEDPQSQIDALKAELRKAQQALTREQEDRVNETNALRSSLTSTEAQLQEMTTELRKVQYRYETRTREVHTMRRTITRHETERASDATRMAKILSDNSGLKDERRKLQEELDAARNTLKEGGGTTGEIEEAREQIRQLEKDNASLEKSNTNMKKDFEFTRQQYQNASTAAAESASRIRDLEAEIVELRVSASDEKRRLKETNFSNDRQRYLTHIALEQAEKLNRETQLQRKDDELRTVRRGRGVQTRASSAQPGSPRLGGMGPNSRGSSPVPGLLSVGRMSALRHER